MAKKESKTVYLIEMSDSVRFVEAWMDSRIVRDVEQLLKLTNEAVMNTAIYLRRLGVALPILPGESNEFDVALLNEMVMTKLRNYEDQEDGVRV